MALKKISRLEQQLARAIVQAVAIREASFNHTAANEAQAKFEQEQADWAQKHPTLIFPGWVEYSQFYTKTLEESLDQACEENHLPPSLARLFYLSLDSWWNDTRDWANRILDPTATHSPTDHNCQHGRVYPEVQDSPIEEVTEPAFHCPLCEFFFKRMQEKKNG